MWECRQCQCCQCGSVASGQCCQLAGRGGGRAGARHSRGGGCRVAPPRWRLSMWRRGARRKRCRRWRNGCDPRAAATRKMRVVPVRRVRRPRPEGGRSKLRPSQGGALLFVPIVFGLRAEHPAAFLGGAFVMENMRKPDDMVLNPLLRKTQMLCDILRRPCRIL